MKISQQAKSMRWMSDTGRSFGGTVAEMGRFHFRPPANDRGCCKRIRAIPRDELRESFYNSLGHLRVDENGIGPSRQPLPQNCALCHSSNAFISHQTG